ncbi:MAG TPA: hypothetical protein ENJ09_04650 [Planctomycetes bacterium]|nr:hypothetical protein [Planctomycetota bacterium]
MRGLLATICFLGLLSGRAGAQRLEHPAVPFLDGDGARVVDTGAPVSTMKTCGACHDTEYIATHSYHVSLGSAAERAARFDALTLDAGDPGAFPDGGIEAWIRTFGRRHVGGGVAQGTEMNCFLCHLPAPATAERESEIARGSLDAVPTATLAGTGLVSKSESGWTWNKEAFDDAGAPDPTLLALGPPSSTNCGVCHGAVEMDPDAALFLTPGPRTPETATTGAVFSPGRIRRSGMNVEGKEELSRPWDVHAARLLECSSCHGAPNDPADYIESPTTRPGHMKAEARGLDLAEFLRTPNHDFRKGRVSQAQAGQEVAGSMRRCEDCHDASASHGFLPYAERHFERLQCEACHIPAIHAPLLESIDWTVLDEEGEPRLTYRGVEGDPSDPRTLVAATVPTLLPRTDEDGTTRLSPQNLVSVFYWVDGQSGTVVPPTTLREVLRGDAAPQTTEEVRRALLEAGVGDPKIRGAVRSYGIHHGVAPASWAVRDCSACHGATARFSEPVALADTLPGGVMPEFAASGGVALAGSLERNQAGALELRVDPRAAGLSPLGYEPDRWVDRIGLWLFVLTLCGVLIHGGTRVFLHFHPKSKGRPSTDGVAAVAGEVLR